MDGVKASSANNVGGSKHSKGALDGARKQAASPVDGPNRKQQAPQPKAWQGPNPITQRASPNTTNGTEKPLPKLPPQAQGKSSGDSRAEKNAHDRLVYLIAELTGCDATLTLKNGEQFTGVFSGFFDLGSKCQYTLKMVKRTRLPSHQQVNGTVEVPDEYTGEGEDHVMSFDLLDTVDLAAADVSITSAQPMQNGSTSTPFRTDTEISRKDGNARRDRELQRWDAGADSSIDMSLEESSGAGWDQFAANERMYGVQSTYDENIYTTAIDRSNPQYRKREAEAARLAREIEGSTAANSHVAEERRRDADKGDGLDEEEKYSGVRREGAADLPKRGTGSYIPPSQRPITSTPTVPGAPYDPAIISTSKPPPSISVPPAASVKSTEPIAVEPVKQLQAQPPAAETSTKAISAPAPVPSQAAKKPMEHSAEDNMRKTADAFKEFANMEKLRIRTNQEAKKVQVKQDKNVRLNDLKKFAMNFKLNTRVPEDLVPILAKDQKKQAEIQTKAEEAANEAEAKAEAKKKEQKAAGATPPTPSGPPSQPSAPPTTDPRLPFNNNHHPRAKASQQMRAPLHPGQGPAPRALPSQRMQPNYGGRGAPQPFPTDLRIPTGPAAGPVPASDRAPLSPVSATGLNVNARAFEFRPVANAFMPSGTTPSPQRATNGNGTDASTTSKTNARFFAKDRKPVDAKDRKDVFSSFNPLKLMTEEEHPEEHKKSLAGNGGIPQPYRTAPVWSATGDNSHASYKDSFPKVQVPSQGPSPLHTPNSNGPMPHAHQLPVHMQAPQMSTPQQRPQFYAQQHHGPAPSFDPRMQQFGPGGSVQSSPRFQPPNLAFNGQMPHMQMPQFGGQPMPGYGMSPSMAYRQPQVMQGGPMMMPSHQQGQAPQMRQGFQQGPPYGGPPMGGQMMVPNPSGGGYMNGPPMSQQQQQGYSPMPPHAQPNLPHMQGAHGGPGGYQGNPRPQMMQQQGSHQGFPPQMQQHMQPPFAPSPGQPHPYHYQRQMSGQGGYPQMTPRQQQAVPQHPSPGMAQGDEGK
ncbi:hypothetical protein LTR08_007084 [Meristemomyces frigidus]|nr:hypothetical protein LTR08_007084 [Meristemomyces frigidus]